VFKAGTLPTMPAHPPPETVMSESTVILSAERILKECRVGTETIRQLHGAYRRPVERIATQSAGWHGPDEIVTLEGLGGEFLWAENPLQPARITFVFDPGHVGSQGHYKLSRLAGMPEEGVFYCVPNNPAIGWAFIALLPKTGSARPFIVGGMFTDAASKISILLLNKTDAQGPVDPPFAAQRIA
jgi:hypothetical protein